MITRILPAILLSTMMFASCVQKEYYEVTPDPAPVGYAYSFNDEFDYDAHNWSFTDRSNYAHVDVSNGTLIYSYNPVNEGTNTVAIATGANMRRDFLIQTRMKSNYAMGLVFGVSNSDYGYSLFVDNEGYFALYDEGDASNGVKTILDWQYSSALNPGWNDIEFEQVGSYWTGYANGVKLFEVPAQPISGNKTGYIVMDGTTGYADYLTMQW